MSNAAEGLPSVTVAILAYNRRDALAVNLQKVSEIDYPRDRLEVIVVDNASEDGTAEMVRERFPEVELIVTERNVGIAGWNRAFERGTGDWFLVLDDDCSLEGDGLRRALGRAAEHDADLVSFAVDSPEPGAVFTDWYRTGLLLFWGCAALVSRRAYERVGGFDENLFIWAHECEWTMRFLDNGFRHLHLPEVRALHMKPLPEGREYVHTINVRNLSYMAAKLVRGRDLPIVFGRLLLRSLVVTLRYPSYWPAFGAAFTGLRKGLKVRRPVSAPVSRLYRRNFIEFSAYVSLRSRIAHVLVHRRKPGTEFFNAYWDARPQLYPQGTGTLRLR